jgi:hypothetical protein
LTNYSEGAAEYSAQDLHFLLLSSEAGLAAAELISSCTTRLAFYQNQIRQS